MQCFSSGSPSVVRVGRTWYSTGTGTGMNESSSSNKQLLRRRSSACATHHHSILFANVERRDPCSGIRFHIISHGPQRRQTPIDMSRTFDTGIMLCSFLPVHRGTAVCVPILDPHHVSPLVISIIPTQQHNISKTSSESLVRVLDCLLSRNQS